MQTLRPGSEAMPCGPAQAAQNALRVVTATLLLGILLVLFTLGGQGVARALEPDISATADPGGIQAATAPGGPTATDAYQAARRNAHTLRAQTRGQPDASGKRGSSGGRQGSAPDHPGAGKLPAPPVGQTTLPNRLRGDVLLAERGGTGAQRRAEHAQVGVQP